MIISKRELSKIKVGDTEDAIIADIESFDAEINNIICEAGISNEDTAEFKITFTYEIGMSDECKIDIMENDLIIPIRAHATNEAINIVGKYFSKLGYKVVIKLLTGPIYSVSLELK